MVYTEDALNVVDGQLVGPNTEFTPDMDTAKKSLGKFTQYDVETVVCYHGGVYQGNVKERLMELAKDLTRSTNKTVVFGHSPTLAFIGRAEIFIAKDRIGVDTGAGHNKRLSAFDTRSQCCYSVEVSN